MRVFDVSKKTKVRIGEEKDAFVNCFPCYRKRLTIIDLFQEQLFCVASTGRRLSGTPQEKDW